MDKRYLIEVRLNSFTGKQLCRVSIGKGLGISHRVLHCNNDTAFVQRTNELDAAGVRWTAARFESDKAAKAYARDTELYLSS